ncbi:MAG TPA: tetratricopeptide repeat protein [bacterium]|nr:tetratricopeptide repeat protein [bacterium]
MKKIFLAAGLIVLFSAAITVFPEKAAAQPDASMEINTAGQQAAATASETRAKRYFDAGEKLFKKRQYEEAFKYFGAAARLNPKDKEAWKKAAFCAYQLKRHNVAFNAFKKVLALDDSDKEAKDFMDFYKTMQEKAVKKQEPREMTGPLWRSALLPGWGQVYNNQTVKGILFGSAFLTSLGLTIYNINDASLKYNRYINTNENHDIAFKEAEDSNNTAIMWAVILGAVYAGNLVDAALNYDSLDAMSVTLRPKNSGFFIAASAGW